MKKFITTLLLIITTFAVTHSQNIPPTVPKWGVEAELIAPFLPEVGIFTAKVTRTLFSNTSYTRHGDLLLGVYLRPNVKHDVVEKISEYLFTAGYRHYFTKGFHIEAQADIGYADGQQNKIDGKDYNNFSLLGEINAGYRLNLSSRKPFGIYLLPQIGFLQGLSTDIGPRGGKSDGFVQGKLSVGFSF